MRVSCNCLLYDCSLRLTEFFAAKVSSYDEPQAAAEVAQTNSKIKAILHNLSRKYGAKNAANSNRLLSIKQRHSINADSPSELYENTENSIELGKLLHCNFSGISNLYRCNAAASGNENAMKK